MNLEPVPVKWYPSKHELPTAVANEAATYATRFVLSKDKLRAKRPGAKEYAVFETPQAACTYVERRRGGSYYEVLEHKNSPCHIYFDLDRHDTAFAYATVKRDFVAIFHRMGGGINDLATFLTGAQFSDGSRENKTSMHVKLKAIAPSVVHVLEFTNMINAYILEHATEYPSLVVKPSCAPTTTILDTNVHSNFQNFRMLHMTKAHRDGTELRPDPTSSDACIEHTIGCYDVFAPTYEGLPALAKEGVRRRDPVPLGASPPPASVVANADHSDYVNAWDGIRAHFPAHVEVVSYEHDFPKHRYKLAHETVCPYVGRAHQRNNVYLHLDGQKQQAEVHCYDDECEQIQRARGGRLEMDLDTKEMIKLHDEAYGHVDLHTQQDNIVWDDEYSAPSMRDLPVKKLVCVRAGMGIGKTIAIRGLLARECKKHTKVLCVTFSRSLAAKLHRDFENPEHQPTAQQTAILQDGTCGPTDGKRPEPLGFVNYQDHKGDLNFPKVVVCLDSLHRVTTSNFHFVVLDEAVSVFLHFNSKLMKNSSINSWKLELFIRQCQCATYFVDAALDTTFMMNIVDYFSKAIGCKPHWIRNKYIRASARKAVVTTCGASGGCIVERSLVMAAIQKVKTLLLRGDRVVVCSSTKAFTETLGQFVAKTLPQTRVLVYNSSRPDGDGCGTSLDDVNRAWVEYDLLVYSPSVSAGVSFTRHHYDTLVAYLVNSEHTPSVDLSLQQLFRVRNLGKGEMYIHVHDNRPSIKLPYTVRDIERHDLNPALSVSSSPMYYEAQMMINPYTNALAYDTERLSYQVLLGIKLMHNRSAMFYTDLLCSTLKEDYAIDIVKQEVDLLSGEDYDVDIDILKAIRTTKTSVPFEDLTLLDADAYDAMRDAGASHTDKELAEMKLYVYQKHIYGVDDACVDTAFYDACVRGNTAYDAYLRNKRFRLMCENELVENKRIYARKMGALMSRQDYNLDLHKKLMSTHHKLLLTSQAILSSLLDARQLSDLCAHRAVVVKEADASATLGAYTTGLKTERPPLAADFYAMYQITVKSGTLTTLKNILKRGLGLEVARGAQNTRREAYTDLHICSRYDHFEARYLPTYPTG